MKKLFSWFNNDIEVSPESKFECVGEFSKNKLFIKGKNNQLEVAENAKITNYEIVIKGKNNSLTFENDTEGDGNFAQLTIWQEEEDYE
ncbi:MAG: hypothetical protein F6K62_20185 [Sphaerospermopsis sp. SIO1G2]|nr:hypothetical protein [Sphaerospermopsis sp. SIO1G1]NET73162.1 hypothetical protein [Sphaerospermopsis sp. SIO1G2]